MGQAQLANHPSIIPAIISIFTSDRHLKVLIDKKNAMIIGTTTLFYESDPNGDGGPFLRSFLALAQARLIFGCLLIWAFRAQRWNVLLHMPTMMLTAPSSISYLCHFLCHQTPSRRTFRQKAPWRKPWLPRKALKGLVQTRRWLPAAAYNR